MLSRVIKGVRVTAKASTVGQKPATVMTDKSITLDLKYRILSNHIISNAENKAAALLYSAQEQSRSILDEAVLEAKAIKEKARSQGYTLGYQEGKNEALNIQKKALTMLENARLERKDIIDSAEPKIITLALEMAERIVHRELDLDNSLLLDMLRGIKAEALGREIVIRVNPKLLPVMQARESELQLIFPPGNFRLEPDPGVEKGVILETEMATIDATVSAQLDELEKTLKEVMHNDK